MVEFRSMVVKGYRERLLKVLRANDIFKILRDIGLPDIAAKSELKGTDLDGREYLLMHWTDDIRDRVMEIIRRNIEFEIRL